MTPNITTVSAVVKSPSNLLQGQALLISGTVFALILVFKHGEVGLVTGFGDVMFFEGFEHGTARFVGMGAVGETAVFGELEDFLEITCQFFGFYVEGAEAFDARGVDEPREISRLRSR